MNWKDLGESLAKLGLPLLGAALPIPGGAAIGTALASAIGADSANPDDILAKITASSDAVLQARQFELTHQETMMQMQLKNEADMYASEVADRASARALQATDKSLTLSVLAYIVVGSFIMMVASTLLGYAKVDSVLAGSLVGYLSAKAEQVIAFYFGSSRSSNAKDALLANSTPLPVKK